MAMAPSPNEHSPLLPPPPAQPRDDPQSPSLGTPRFPFHPHARSTPRWRKLFMHLFDNFRSISALHDSDMWPLAAPFQGARAAADLEKHMPTHGRWLLLRAVCGVNRRRLLAASALRLLGVALSVLRPLLLYRLVTGGDNDADLRNDLLPLAGIALLPVVLSVVSCHAHDIDMQVDLQTYSALYAMITDRIINTGSVHMAVGANVASPPTSVAGHKQRLTELTKMLTNDVMAIGNFLVAATNVWANVLKLAASVTVLVYVIDISHVVVWTVVVTYTVVFAVGLLVGEPLAARAESALVFRLNTVHECLKGIQMVKLNAWEDKMEAKILDSRKRERVAANRLFTLSLVLQQLIDDSPMLFVAVALGVNTWNATPASAEKPFTPTVVFVALILISDCLQSARFLKYAFETSLIGVGAWRRVEAFLLSERSTKSATATVPAAPPHARPSGTALVAMSGVCLSSPTTSSSSPTLLINVEWQIHRGELVVIHGAAGLGKSMLLAAIRQDTSAVQVLQGSLLQPMPADCRVAYCSQDPWLQALSIRDNILFGTPFDEHKYWTVVNACGLLEDLTVLPFGDATAVGPRGINLSSGQCARIALARACYADADLYLLDCPLANVDAIVQSEIFHKCIAELLLFKTVVIVTHNPEYIGSSYVDQLVHVQPLSVRVTNRASRRNLHKKSSPPVSRRLRDHQHTMANREPGDRSLHMPPLSRDALRLVDRLKASKIATQLVKDQADQVKRVISPKAMCRSLFDAHRGYALLCLALAGLWGVTCVTRDVWIMKWAAAWSVSTSQTDTAATNRLDLDYAYLVAVCALFGFATRGCVSILVSQLANRLFTTMTRAVLHSSMALFYHTPIGETINRYYSDMMMVDELLPRHLGLFVQGVISFLTRVLIVAWVLGPAGVFVLVIGYALAAQSLAIPFCVEVILLLLRAKARQLSLMAEVVDGEAVIRAFGEQRALHVFRALDDVNDSHKRTSYFMMVFNNSILVAGELEIAAVILVLLGILATRNVSPDEYGLVLLYIFMLQQDVIGRFSTGLANVTVAFSSVKRLREYGDLVVEEDADPSEQLLVSSHSAVWPQHGSVVFDRVNFSYYTSDRPSGKTDTLALQDVSFSLKSGEKVGVIGRTGSGKSSLAMALLRVHPLRSGRILLDGVDLRTVPLSQLRRSITMIPQSPTFYRCSVRDYLDPFHEFDDARLWSELLTVELGSRVQSLEEELLDNGENWSLGQRQLLCFARALLKPSRVVVLDESFSCVDQSCQEKILRIVRERMSMSTVILITHRLDQILAFDRILVMSRGRLVESGSASELASDPESVFYEFLESSLLTF